MQVRLSVLIAGAFVLGTVMLGLRQQRVGLAHEMAVLHQQINQTRQNLWGLQTRIAQKVEPVALYRAMGSANLVMEPVTSERRPGRGVLAFAAGLD